MFSSLFTLQSDTVIYLVTEPVQPLEVLLSEDENSKADFAISWGLHQITVCTLTVWCIIEYIQVWKCSPLKLFLKGSITVQN